MVLQTWEIITLVVLVGVFLLSGILVGIILLRRKNWPFNVTILEQDPKTNNLVIGSRDRAKLIPFGDGGQRIFFCKRTKRYAADYGKRIGKNAVAFALGTDGYLYNIIFQGIDKKLMEIGVTPTETSARLANSSLRKGVQNRFNDKSFYEKWGAAITIGMLIAAIAVQAGGSWLSHKEDNKGKAQEVEITKLQKESIELIKETLANIDNIRSGGSGIAPA